MLMRLLGFVLETIFVLLIGAALVRGYMNGLRVNMQVQPGVFVMALTNWLVKPLRRWLPQALVRARLDWASYLAALLLALLYALVWGSLMGFPVDAGMAVLALKLWVRVALQTASLLVLAWVVLSWVQPGSPTYHLLGRLVEPGIQPLRKIVPVIGGVDLSPMVLLLLLQAGLMILG